MKLIACTEGHSSKIEAFSLEMIAAARSLAQAGDEVVAFFAGGKAEAASSLFGAADRLIVARATKADVIPAETYAVLLREVVTAESPGLVLVPYSANGLDVAADISARTGWPLISYVNEIKRHGENLTVVAQMYGGKILADCEVQLPAILMINPGAFAEAAPGPIAAASVQTIDAEPTLASGKVRMVAIDVPDYADVDLTTAERIVCVGRGIGDEASIDLARNLATMLGAEIAGSRPVVDNGWLPKLRQVGKSGQKVKPKLYLALGVSGAPEHLEGMSQADLIIAVNTDPKAPIFNVAHYGATCDLFDLVANLSDRLRAGSGR
ncbi:electron transfer flavoprotein subunit alpha/FixB family protein [Mesorhizobium sp. M7A.F.Ca.MR.245.00.0.0]|uniref:electron transfer flavoprotein subunit alpha/FixB family protein n=1 Tax=Mesorhizobium sp. M7A.F.Ca.MR.245.00.0.0 TaxID=2496778 RepID=UPI000FCA2513|nr:electron transfer flavoprotein subunit alpha/FixB family protein [Mesorhizobium sp. M7A.F.Ca.MR.245.00.0.0]RUV13261.1 electron transfer flavoprotein subunit alpha/FixB family protein [Mesorhizobium sp. M7A.T.Ca.TU.009.01.3.1]RUV17840.1 electron transfer flavoprotein subunit alpha/FixB family protein [Mesorhizobium sp. M7A.F.Ca.MR.245.00.0.0]RUV53327.1 electron transfer flavoprotein subunit alpha/FixB family protein [Mesorhizobium sp. M7A.F.Ca.MR.228.00.0.0]